MMLKVENLTKMFGGVKAVDNVSFAVRKGELSSIIGPNGAGKSTLLNLLCGYHKRDSGKILLEGDDISERPPYQICRKGIGRSFQIVSLFHQMTSFDNIQTAILANRSSVDFVTPARGIMRDETGNVLRRIGLWEKADRIASQLSHGEQKRLEIGIALGGKPRVLLLDEPCAGLGLEETRDMVTLIQYLSKEEGLTIIVVEHKMDVVFAVSEIIRVLYMGRIIFDGRPEDAARSEEVLGVYLGGDE